MRQLLRRVPPRLRRIVLAEMRDPESREVLVPLLHKKDPASALARRLSEEISEEVFGEPESEDGLGLGKRKKKRGFKRVVKNIKRIKKKTGKVIKKAAPTLLNVAGAVLAPFTGGASLAASSLITTGYSVARKKREAKKAEKRSRREARALEAQAKAEEARIAKEADDLYAQAPDVFASAGVTPEMWSSMTTEEKLGAIEKINRREPVASKEDASKAPVAMEMEAAEEEVKDLESKEIEGDFEVVVEGRSAGKAKDTAEASKLAFEASSEGDRVEIYEGRRRVGGLRVRTDKDLVEIPQDMEARVKALPKEELVKFVRKGEEKAEAKSGRGVPWWLILAGGGAAAAALL
jgi:hypothetical protein